MIRLGPLLLLCLVYSAAGLRVLNQQYQVKSISSDGWNGVSVVLFQVEFDAPLAVGNLSLASFNSTTTSSLVNLAMFNVTTPLNLATASLLGIPSLQCPGNYSFSSIPADSDLLTEEQVIPVASTIDPVVGFFNSLQVQGATNFVAPMTVLDRWFSAIFVLEDRRTCDAFAGCAFDTGFSARMTDVNFSECTLTFNEGWSATATDDEQAGEAVFLHAVGNLSDAFVNQSVTNFTVKEVNYCNSVELEEAIYNFETASHYISGNTFEDLSASFWRAMMFGMADPVLSCQLLMSDLLNETTFHGQASTDRCLVPDPVNSSDPCCNKTLRFGGQCCSEREKPYSFPSAAIATTARQQLKDAKCVQRRLLMQALQDFLLSDIDNLHPTTGCSATAQAIASQSVFDGYYSFVSECRDIVEVAAEPCSENSDCISDVCYSLQCRPDFDSGYGGDAHTLCFAETMPEQVAAIAKVYLGIPGANQSTFVEQMEAQLWDYQCNSYLFRSLFIINDDSNEFGFTVTQETEEQCSSFLITCAYSAFIFAPAVCLNPPSWAVVNASDPGICAICSGESCIPLLYGPRCAYSVFDPDSCAVLGGVWDVIFSQDLPCTVPLIDNEFDCLPLDFCPPESAEADPTWYEQTRCQSSYCINTTVTSAEECASIATDLILTHWNTSINNGICMTSQDSVDCSTSGNEYWTGRVWRSGLYNTPESCAAGACGVNSNIQIGEDGANCVNYACTSTCSMCGASSPNVLNNCFNLSISSLVDCTNAGGTWASQGFCYFSNYQHEPGCLAAGLDWFECKDLVTPGECVSCNSPNCQAMQCAWQTSLPCNDEQECLQFGGTCSDIFALGSVYKCENGYYDPQSSCISNCVIPPQLDDADTPTCLNGTPTNIGCVDYYIEDELTCGQLGGHLVNLSWNKDTCLSGGYGCLESEFAPFFTPKNESQCNECSGSWTQAFEWTPPKWIQETPYPFHWRPIEMVPTLTWERMMNYTKLEEAVSYAAILRTTLSLRSEAECLLNPLLSMLRLLACSCGDNTGADDKLYCQTAAGQVRQISVGSSLFCSGISGFLRNGGFLFSYRNDTIAESYGCIEAVVNSIPVVQFATNRPKPLSSLSLNNVGVQFSDNPYAVLKNQYGRQIGQLISNGINLTLEVLSTASPVDHKASANSTNSTFLDATPTITVQSLTVCFEQNANVEHDQLFPVLDLAYLKGDSWHLLGVNVSLLLDDRLRTFYCANVSNGGLFAPVYRVTNPDQGNQQFSTVERVFILILVGLYLFGFLICLFLTVVLLYIHGFKGFFRNLFFGKQLATMILVLLLCFSGIRGIWLLLVGTGVDNENSSVAVDTVLTSLPIYIFFTLFTLLICFWASLWHYQFEIKKTVLGPIKIPFLLVNLAIYIFFIVIVAVYLRTDNSSQSDVNIIFQCIVAGIGFTILVLFLLYGTLMFITSYQLLNRVHSSSRGFFYRMTAVTMTCSVASLVQFIFLLLFTFKGYQQIYEALIYFFIVEVIPFYILLYLFFQPSKLSMTLKATYTPNSSVRSLPKLFTVKRTTRESIDSSTRSERTQTSSVQSN